MTAIRVFVRLATLSNVRHYMVCRQKNASTTAFFPPVEGSGMKNQKKKAY